MKKYYLMIFAIATLAGMLVISGCKKDESTAQDDALGNQGTLTVSGIHNGHGYVDLGLPSGLLWATCNVGATIPEGYGDYFAWGETSTKSTYTEDNYTYSDNPTTLPPSADAATANWGVGWRMPTNEEMVELLNNCTHVWTTHNGVKGRLFTGPNGNSIFLPAAGGCDGSGLGLDGTVGIYWSSSLDNNMYDALYLDFYLEDDCYTNHDFRRLCGFTVRAVCQSQN